LDLEKSCKMARVPLLSDMSTVKRVSRSRYACVQTGP
jgi:hypothetical protein